MGQYLSCLTNSSAGEKLDVHVGEILSPLSGVCTYYLLHQARIHRYGENYHLCPGALDTPVPLESDGVGHIAHRDRAESLLALSRAGHVPNDTPHTREFELPFRRLVHQLLNTFWEGKKPVGYYGSTWPPSWYRGFRVQPIGSFPCDTKVGDIDEFDYLCVVDVEKNTQWKMKGGCIEWMAVNIDEMAMFFRNSSELSKLAHSRDDISKELSISAVYSHGPATCMEVSWACDKGHHHSSGVDITMAVAEGHQHQNHIIKEELQKLPQPLRILATDPEIVNHERHLFINSSFSSCIYDRDLFNALQTHVTGRIGDVYRLLKLIIKHTMPQEAGEGLVSVAGFQVSPPLSSRDIDSLMLGKSVVHASPPGIIETDERVTCFRTCPVLSSHALKCLLYEEVRRHPTPGDWEGQGLVDRVLAVLAALKVTEEGNEDSNISWPICREFITQVDMSKAISSYILHGTPSIIETIDSLRTILSGDSALTCEDTRTCIPDTTYGYFWGRPGVLHKARLHKDTVLGDTNPVFYPATTGEGLPYLCHPMIQWCGQYVDTLYRTNSGVDLTRLPGEDLQPDWYRSRSKYHFLWGLVYGGTLGQEDIDSGRYHAVLDKMKGLMEENPAEDMWKDYLFVTHLRNDHTSPVMRYVPSRLAEEQESDEYDTDDREVIEELNGDYGCRRDSEIQELVLKYKETLMK